MSVRSTPGGRRFLAVLFAVPIAFSVLFFAVNTVLQNNDTHLLSLETLNNKFAHLRSLANDAEAGQHGFLLTGKERYRISVQSATRLLAAEPNVDTHDVPRDIQDHFRTFLRLLHDRVAIANHVLDVQQQASYGEALDAARDSHSERVMDDLRAENNWLQDHFVSSIQNRFDEYRTLTRISFLLFLFGTLTMLIVMVWLYNTFLDHMQARDAANNQLQGLNAELEHRISERTKELQEFNDELQQFAYVASHDLQEPLRTVTSFAQLLASRYHGKLDADADEFIDYIVNSARRMTDLINGLLALVRLRKSGQQMSPVPLASLVEQAEGSLQAAIRESGARIEVGELPALNVDAMQFTQVLQNLIANAIKYRRDETPLIRIAARRDSTNWIISVEDNGRGFDSQYAERIFALFQRLHVREVDGTGMGLTIVRRIIERHGGRIWAESKEGRGSSFFISLPTSLEPHASDWDADQTTETIVKS